MPHNYQTFQFLLRGVGVFWNLNFTYEGHGYPLHYFVTQVASNNNQTEELQNVKSERCCKTMWKNTPFCYSSLHALILGFALSNNKG